MTKNQDFGKLLKDIRIGKRLRQEDVEYLTGISVRSLSRLENGNIKSLGADSLILLSQAYEEDLLDMYYKSFYQTNYLYKEITSKLGMASIFIDKNQVLILSKKLEIIENDRILIGKERDVKLLRLFIDRLINKKFDKEIFKETYEDIRSKSGNKNALLDRKYSPIEMRILLNICNDFREYDSFSSYEILEKLSKECDNHTVKMLIYNSLINRLYVDYRSKEALNLLEKAIAEAKAKRDIEALSSFYYDKFICDYDLGYDSYKEAMALAKLSADLTRIPKLKEIIYSKSKGIIEK